MRMSKEKKTTRGNCLPERGERKCFKNKQKSDSEKRARYQTQRWPTSKFWPALSLLRSFNKGKKTQDSL